MATLKEHTRDFSGTTYTTRTLPASKGLIIMPKLMALFGEALVGLFFATDEKARETLLEDPKILAAVIASIAEKAAETDGLLVIKDLLIGTRADKVKVGDVEVEGSVHDHFDEHFSGRYRHLVEVAVWVGTCNFMAP
jgi:hypothetical protein